MKKNKKVTLARPKAGTRPNVATIGVILPTATDEQNSIWRTESSRLAMVRKMRRTDPDVIAFLNAYKDPIKTTSWSIVGDKQDQIDFVTQNLFQRIRWNDFLNDALRYLDYGYMVFEKCWVQEDGKWWLDKLAPRYPGTFTWKLNQDQVTWDGIEQSVGGKTVLIPMDKLVILVNDKEGNHFTGESVVRQLYKPWKLKEKTEMTMDSIIQRNGMGIPVANAPDTISEEDEERIVEWLGNVAANDTAYFYEKGDVKFRFQAVEGQLVDPSPFLKHLSTDMLTAGAQGVFGLATANRGSSATGDTLSGLYYDRIAAVATIMCDAINHDLIQQMVLFNFGPQPDGKYPELISAGIAAKGIFAKAEALAHLRAAGFVWPEKGINRYLRNALDLPPLPPGEDTEPEKSEPNQKSDSTGGGDTSKDATPATKKTPATNVVKKEKANASTKTAK